MRRLLLSGAFASAIYLTCSVSSFGANLVSDGDFTTTPLHPGINTFNSGQTFGPWTVIGAGCGTFGCAGVDIVQNNTFQAPPGGGNVVDLNGLAPGGITQTLALTNGDEYQLSFYLSGNPGGTPETKDFDVSIGNLSKDLHYTLTSSNQSSSMNYVLERLTFTANGNDLLSFSSDDPKDSAWGAVIGNVSVVSVIPEPAMWAVFLVGFGVLGFVLHSRRKYSNAIRSA